MIPVKHTPLSANDSIPALIPNLFTMNIYSLNAINQALDGLDQEKSGKTHIERTPAC